MVRKRWWESPRTQTWYPWALTHANGQILTAVKKNKLMHLNKICPLAVSQTKSWYILIENFNRISLMTNKVNWNILNIKPNRTHILKTCKNVETIAFKISKKSHNLFYSTLYWRSKTVQLDKRKINNLCILKRKKKIKSDVIIHKGIFQNIQWFGKLLRNFIMFHHVRYKIKIQE